MPIIPDTYINYADLAANETEGVDYEIVYTDRGSRILCLANHGGGIELGTTEMAERLAENMGFNFYSFRGLKGPGENRDLHITSSNFDEPIGDAMSRAADYCVAFHGASEQDWSNYMGGIDTLGLLTMEGLLKQNGYIVRPTEPRYGGVDPDNIVNRCKSKKGLQVEMGRLLRDLIRTDNDELNALSAVWESYFALRKITESNLNIKSTKRRKILNVSEV